MNLHIARNSPAATSSEPAGPGLDCLATAGAVTRQETAGTAARYSTRELKQPRRQHQGKRHLKDDFQVFQTSSR